MNIRFRAPQQNSLSATPSPARQYRENSLSAESKASSTASSSRAASLSPQVDLAELRGKLREGCVRFSAHYLGSAEISNVEGTEDCRRAMNAAKVELIYNF